MYKLHNTVDIAVSMENLCYIDSICYKLKYFNRISMILSSICHVNVDHCQQHCHLQFTMVCADTEIGLGLDSENNNIRICRTSGAAEIKNREKGLLFFSNLPKSRVGGFEKLFIKKLWPNTILLTYNILIVTSWNNM